MTLWLTLLITVAAHGATPADDEKVAQTIAELRKQVAEEKAGLAEELAELSKLAAALDTAVTNHQKTFDPYQDANWKKRQKDRIQRQCCRISALPEERKKVIREGRRRVPNRNNRNNRNFGNNGNQRAE